MEDVFIKEIKINKVRHLQDITIPISNDERKHLIITGKNGSGKTSLLEATKNIFIEIQSKDLIDIPQKKINIKSIDDAIRETDNTIRLLKDEDRKNYHISNKGYLNDLKDKEETKYIYSITIDFNINNLNKLYDKVFSGELILACFKAERSTKLNNTSGIQKIELFELYNINEIANKPFLQYIVNLKAQRSFARDANNLKLVEEIDNWFTIFENFLKELFEDESLVLEFDSEEFNFNIIQKDKEKFTFNTLSDGYSAVLDIVTELIMRMEKKSTKTYDVQGIVLIDEIETHLHIELQKMILPFLTKVFPRVQFIVTTHSPFVINSISNAVIFDLENRIPVSDLSSYSVDGIIEGYFNSDKYSAELKKLVAEYELLYTKKQLDETEKERQVELKKYFRNIPKFLAPELELKIQQIELLKIR